MRKSQMLWVALFVLLAGSIAAYAQQQNLESPGEAAVAVATDADAVENSAEIELPVEAAEAGAVEDSVEIELFVDPFADAIPVTHCPPTGFHASSQEECEALCGGPAHWVPFTGCCFCA